VPEPGDSPDRRSDGLVDVTLPWSGLASPVHFDRHPADVFAR
jgi:hypothetical protein